MPKQINVRIETVRLDSLKPTKNNPRKITKKDFEILKLSVEEFPEMMTIREIVVDENYTILGGHQRVKALLANGRETMPVKVVTGLTDEQKREFIIKDNIANGEWDDDVLREEWSNEPLNEWGLDISNANDDFDDVEIKNELIVEIKCADEAQQEQIYNEMIERGFECKTS